MRSDKLKTIALRFKLGAWYEMMLISKALFGDENAISEMVESNAASTGMMSLGVFVALVGPKNYRVIELAGPGGKTDPRNRGFSALNYVGADQLDPAHTNRAPRVAKRAELEVERKLRRRDGSGSRDSRFESPPVTRVDSAVVTRSPVDEEAAWCCPFSISSFFLSSSDAPRGTSTKTFPSVRNAASAVPRDEAERSHQ